MKKYNVMEEQTETEVRRAQVIYLHNVLGWTCTQIQKVVKLAKSTITSYYSKYKNLLEKAKQWFGEVTTTMVTKAIELEEKIVDIPRKIRTNANIIFECDNVKGNVAYIIEHYNSNNNLLWLKVGKTNDTTRRFREHLRDYQKKGIDVTKAVIKKLYPCGIEEESGNDALTMENILRKHYMQKYPNNYVKQDRFLNIPYNEEEIQKDKKIAMQYALILD